MHHVPKEEGFVPSVRCDLLAADCLGATANPRMGLQQEAEENQALSELTLEETTQTRVRRTQERTITYVYTHVDSHLSVL